jgi:kynureninase
VNLRSEVDEANVLAGDMDDPAIFRDRFVMPRWSGGEVAYFAGNSLGLQPKATADVVDEVMRSWAERGVSGHFTGEQPWSKIAESLAGSMAGVVGAHAREVVLMNTLTVNLHLLMVAFYRPTADRFKVVIESGAFPSDDYVVASQVRLHGFDPSKVIVRVAPRPGEQLLRTEDIIAALDDSVAVVLLPGINFRSGQLFDMKTITTAVHDCGAFALWDLAHAAGNVELALHHWDVDGAAWCTYKYLNSGPGAVAAMFVHDRHVNNPDLIRLNGWWGNNPDTRFAMAQEIDFAKGAGGWQISNPPILALAPIRAALAIVEEAGGMSELRQRSLRLTSYLESLVDSLVPRYDVSILTPRSANERGAQLSLVIEDADVVTARLVNEFGVVPDDRPPNIIRFAPCPLYSTYADCDRAAAALASVLHRC